MPRLGRPFVDEGPAKPAVLQESRFVVEEGLAYRIFSRGAILLNKLWLSALVLLVVWLVYGSVAGVEGCSREAAPVVVEHANGTLEDQGEALQCSVFLSPTSLYLGGMTILAFTLQVVLGLLGNMVGRRILEATPAAEEVGARRPPT